MMNDLIVKYNRENLTVWGCTDQGYSTILY